jgi:uncharacterized protein
VALTAEPTQERAQTRLKYAARAQVGGKMAQVGSRLIDAAAGKIAEDFFKAFEAHLLAAGGGVVPLGPIAPAAAAPKAVPAWAWVAAAAVVLAAVYFLTR